MQELTVVLCWLRVGLLEQDLAYRFAVSVPTISAMCVFWINFLYEMLVRVPIRPARTTLDTYMPESFRTWDSSTRVVLDCTETFIHIPSDYNTQSETYILYKSHNTTKGIICLFQRAKLGAAQSLRQGDCYINTVACTSYFRKETVFWLTKDSWFEDDLRELAVKFNRPHPHVKWSA